MMRPAKMSVVRMLGRGEQERREPAVADAHVIVEEGDERARAAGEAGVASGVQAAPLVDDVAGAVALCERSRLGRGGGCVVDYEHLRALALGFGAQRAEGDVEVGQALARGDHD